MSEPAKIGGSDDTTTKKTKSVIPASKHLKAKMQRLSRRPLVSLNTAQLQTDASLRIRIGNNTSSS